MALDTQRINIGVCVWGKAFGHRILFLRVCLQWLRQHLILMQSSSSPLFLVLLLDRLKSFIPGSCNHIGLYFFITLVRCLCEKNFRFLRDLLFDNRYNWCWSTPCWCGSIILRVYFWLNKRVAIFANSSVLDIALVICIAAHTFNSARRMTRSSACKRLLLRLEVSLSLGDHWVVDYQRILHRISGCLLLIIFILSSLLVWKLIFLLL